MGAGNGKGEVITSTNTTLQNLDIPGEKRLKSGGGEGIGPQASPAKPGETPVYSVIQTANPILLCMSTAKKVKSSIRILFMNACPKMCLKHGRRTIIPSRKRSI